MSDEVNNSLKWKRRLGRIGGFMRSSERGRRLILIYHAVGSGPLSTDASQFRAQMAWLAEHAEVMSLDALLDDVSNNSDKIRVALTFDDGYRSVHDMAAPVLSGFGFPATVYLNSGHIRDDGHEASDAGQGHYPDEQFMNWSEVLQLRDQGWSIGSHGVFHLDLTQQSEEVVTRELDDSKAEIERRTDLPCEHFSYTWGRSTPAVRAAVAQAGYRTAVGGEHRPLRGGYDGLNLPRLDVRHEYRLEDFVAVVLGKWDYLGYVQRFKSCLR